MLLRLKHGLADHFRDNLGVYFFVTLLFTIGIISGALAVRALNGEQKIELLHYLRVFFNELSIDQNLLGHEVARQAIVNNIKLLVLVWIAGLSVVGFPLIVVIVFTRGFVLGFTVGFLVHEMGWRGILFATLAVIPHNLVVIPAVIMTCVTGLSFSFFLIKSKIFVRSRTRFFPQFWGYTFFFLVMIGVFTGAAFIEAYITPVFMRLLSGLMLS